VGGSLTIDTGTTERVAAALTHAADQLGDPSDLLAGIAQQLGSDASSRAPRATGAMAGSMSAGRTTLEGRPAVTLTWGVRYAAFVNFGTDRMPARPFATDALEAAAATADQAMADWAGAIIADL
jgi:HK97 gp10 family phage protein